MMSIYRQVVAFGGMTLLGGIMSLVRLSSFGLLVDVNRKYIGPAGSWSLLRLVGVKVHRHFEGGEDIGIYMFNHNSFLDIFIIPFLGLKNTRYVISEATKKILPLRLCNFGMKVLYIPTMEDVERRLDFFKKVTCDLREGRYSIICSPEGRHRFDHHIAPFNNGVFHMAQASGRPIRNLFFEIPWEANPLESYTMKSCSVSIHSISKTETKDWQFNDLQKHKQMVRGQYLDYFRKIHGRSGEYIHENSI